VVHGLYADSFKSREEIKFDSPKAHEYVKECEWVSSEAADLVEVGFGIFRVLFDKFCASLPNKPQLDEHFASLNEFYELGLNSINHQSVSR
jgi:hypothetical protein